MIRLLGVFFSIMVVAPAFAGKPAGATRNVSSGFSPIDFSEHSLPNDGETMHFLPILPADPSTGMPQGLSGTTVAEVGRSFVKRVWSNKAMRMFYQEIIFPNLSKEVQKRGFPGYTTLVEFSPPVSAKLQMLSPGTYGYAGIQERKEGLVLYGVGIYKLTLPSMALILVNTNGDQVAISYKTGNVFYPMKRRKQDAEGVLRANGENGPDEEAE